jgi:hypothetical protein
VKRDNVEAIVQGRSYCEMEDVIPKYAIEKGIPVPKIEGLMVMNGCKCSECGKCFGVIKSCKNHIKANHESGAVVESCSVQRLQNISTSPYFCVTELPSSIPIKEGPSMEECKLLLKSSHSYSLAQDKNNVRAQSLLCRDMYFREFLEQVSEDEITEVQGSMKINMNPNLFSASTGFIKHINQNITKDNQFLCRYVEI